MPIWQGKPWPRFSGQIKGGASQQGAFAGERVARVATAKTGLDADGNPIGGLFAAGFCSPRDLYGNGIPGAGGVGMAAVSGYVAGNTIADELGL